ncbi:antirestriction protein [Pelistega indica]|uniref:Antirestriction protein n=1 Tax=Pelistega indica TaxID=1414851 RepID=V8FTG1_9BURK|nr:antirestriction protein [Pelistega indica]ETD66712.1 antirestriction protein [Pelistega indica]
MMQIERPTLILDDNGYEVEEDLIDEMARYALSVIWRYVDLDIYEGEHPPTRLLKVRRTPDGYPYLEPMPAELKWQWRNTENYSNDIVTGGALGIIATLYACSHLSFAYYDTDEARAQRFSEMYQAVYELAIHHAEATAIALAID